ncbi:methyltransferase domain-containing protein [Ideonella sp. NS12-5]|uniref:Methyltransferase domain-containing protein n=2 Tax=Ideonella oryzae TaxID=2937441 RepID=A0ABT1BJH1_9BURK|nr:methyltransferase domain-containing protein [Ideonella oryzae]
MDDPAQIAAFQACGRRDGVLGPVYFYNAVQALPAILPGDRVLDLACGPANQLAEMADLNPDTEFVGVDIAPHMLAQARETLAQHRLDNVQLTQADICRLEQFDDASFDAVTCTLSLHHLEDTLALAQALREAARVLRPGGGVFLADFGRLRRRATQAYFAHDREAEQSPQFTQDYHNSLRAAFSPQELRAAAQVLPAGLRWHATALAPFLLIARHPRHDGTHGPAAARARQRHARMSAAQQRDLQALAGWFRAGGLSLPFPLA